MFNLDQAIAEWRRQMLVSGLRNTEVLNELENHLRDDVEQRMRSGLCAEEAFKGAVGQIGEATSLKHEFAKTATVRGSILRKLVTIAMIANIVFGALAIFGGVAALVSAYNLWTRGVHFAADELWFIRASWSLSIYDAICGFTGIIAAKQLFNRQRSGINLGTVWAFLTFLGIVANSLLRARELASSGFDGTSVFVTGVFLLYPVLFVLLCRNSRMKEQYV